MMKRLPIALLLASSCASSTQSFTHTSFPEAAYQTVTGNAVRVELRTAPSQPPIRGTDAAELAIFDAQGVPLDGLEVEVVPWMPSMGHGSTQPEVETMGNGRYRMERVSFPMPGKWELRLRITGRVSEQVIVPVDVQ
jgi:hypothetical protein